MAKHKVPSIDRLICGCSPVKQHEPHCPMGAAEAISFAAYAAALDTDTHGLVAVLNALKAAGMLTNLPVPVAHDTIECLLDTLWELGMVQAGSGDSAEAAR